MLYVVFDGDEAVVLDCTRKRGTRSGTHTCRRRVAHWLIDRRGLTIRSGWWRRAVALKLYATVTSLMI